MKLFISKVVGLFPTQFKIYIAEILEKLVNLIRNSYFPAEQRLIEKAIVNSNAGKYKEAERNLQEAAMIYPNDPRIAPHLGRIRFLHSRSTNIAAQKETKNMLEVMNAMKQEIESNLIYVPGEFWGIVGKYHLQLLEKYGIENFKRTVSHHYQNWFMVTQDDPQVRELFKTWPTNFTIEPWLNTIEIPDNVGMHTTWNFDKPTYPLAFANQREIYRIAVGLLWEFVNGKDKFNILSQLTESEIGNPIRIWRKGSLISSDLAHSVRERNILLEDVK